MGDRTEYLSSSFTLPCGFTIKNRIVKSALSENVCQNGYPNKKLMNIYHRWREGGCGLLISGHVMVSEGGKAELGNVVINDTDEFKLEMEKWAEVCNSGDCFTFIQLNHCGRQVPSIINRKPLAPSAIPLPGPYGVFGTPKEMSKGDIDDVVIEFANAARICKECRFRGVQLHCAHGYLMSQFLSPKTNKRNDEYGGSISNRFRIIEECIIGIRRVCGVDFPLSVKLNVADCVNGGIEFEDSLIVARKLHELGIDLLEISGGTYEHTIFMSGSSTASREAYFEEFATIIKRKLPKLPLLLTGGVRTPAVMEEMIRNGVTDFVGIGRPLIMEPDFPNEVLNKGRSKPADDGDPKFWIFEYIPGIFPSFSKLTWYQYHLQRLHPALQSKRKSVLFALLWYIAVLLHHLLFGSKESKVRARGNYS